MNESLRAFAENLRQDALALADADDQGAMTADAFMQLAFELLAELGEFEDPLVCYHKSRGIEVSGYAIDEDEGRADLFLGIHTNVAPPVTVSKRAVHAALRRLRTFYSWCANGNYRALEESSPAFDMAAYLNQVNGKLTKLRLCVITDGRATVEHIPDEQMGSITIQSSVWDIVRIYRLQASGRRRDEIVIDFADRLGTTLPCIAAENSAEGYKTFLTLLPGSLLRDVYSEFGPRLLEANVRSFLQARGKVNRGIRDTILNSPNRFLAYNNGITMTARSVDREVVAGITRIERTKGLQIVNGGQTTASMLAAGRGKADLSHVNVPAKLIEIGNEDHYVDFIKDISRYSNSQNRISEADFSSNDPFHVQVEELSRTIWAPAVDGSQRQTKWFYERARGQFQVARSAEPTPAKRRAFLAEHPTKQRFTKTDLAKFENTWDQLPHVVSKGAQKNFADFMIRTGSRSQLVIDHAFFKRLIAKAILFRTAERIIQRQQFGGYRANLVTYTLALISHGTEQRIDLERIWNLQMLSEPMKQVIAETSHDVHAVITNPPGGRNITEWCKSEACWDRIRDRASRLNLDLLRGEVLSGEQARREKKARTSQISPEYVNQLRRIVEISAESWLMLSRWASETGSLDPSERQLVLRIRKAIQRGNQIKPSDAERAIAVLNRANQLGFNIEADLVK